MPTGIDTITRTPPIGIQTKAEPISTTSGADSIFVFGEKPQVTIPCRLDSSFQNTTTNHSIDSLLQSKGIKALNVFLKDQTPQAEKKVEVISMDGEPLAKNVQSRFWFTPCLFILFVLYAFSIASRKKTLNKEIHNLFSPTSSGEMTVNTPIEELQEQMPLLILAAANIAWLAFFSINTFSHTSPTPSVSWISSIIAIGAMLTVQLMLIQAICYVFFNAETFQKMEKLKLLSFSLMGIGLIPSILLMAYSPTFLVKPAIYLGFVVISLLFLLYLLRTLPLFFKGTFSIFYLILYLCTIEILPAIALIIGLESLI